MLRRYRNWQSIRDRFLGRPALWSKKISVAECYLGVIKVKSYYTNREQCG